MAMQSVLVVATACKLSLANYTNTTIYKTKLLAKHERMNLNCILQVTNITFKRPNNDHIKLTTKVSYENLCLWRRCWRKLELL